MLNLMRKHAGTWLIKVILGAIVIVFIFWGVGSYTAQRSNRVASVNGDTISVDEFSTAYNRMVEQYRQSFGKSFNEEMIQTLQLKQQALNQLISQILMQQAAAKLKLSVTDDELADSIRQIPAFQSDGVFDSRRYRSVLGFNRLTPEAFEQSQREALLVDKLRNLISSSVKVSDLEASQWYNWNNASVDLDYLQVDPARYTDIKPSDEEIQKYFESHRDAYKTDPQAKVRYVRWKPEAFADRVSLTEDDLKEYYDDHKEQFESPKTVEARHILIKVGQDADAETVAKAKARIDEIYKMAKAGEDFAELAKKYSEGPTKDRGGYLGAFRREAMVKPFSDKAFSMKAGEISEPVRTRFGWHIIKVEKVNEARTRTFEEARDEIRKQLTAERAKALALEDAEAVSDLIFEGQPLEKVAKDRGLKVVETDYFTQSGPTSGVSDPARFAKVAFDLAAGEFSEVEDFGDGYYLMELVDKTPSKPAEFEAVKDKVRADFIKEKQQEKARQDAAQILKALAEGQSMDSVAKKFGLTVKSTGLFKRNQPIPDIGYEPQISAAAFALSETKKLPDDVIEGQKGFYVIRFKQRVEPAAAEFEKEKADIEQRLRQQKQFRMFEQWLAEKRAESKIAIEERFLK
jgi:peptidyl-prolyl cis-trans isomerase D